jgi:flavoprotein
MDCSCQGGSSWLSASCQQKFTCNAVGAGAPVIEKEDFVCADCNGAGVCNDSERAETPGNVAPEGN